MLFHERLQKLVEDNFNQKKDFITKFLSYSPISKRTKEPIKDKVVYAYLDGTRSPDAEHYPIIAKALGINVQELFGIDSKSLKKANNVPLGTVQIPVITNIKADAGAEGILPDHIEENNAMEFAPKFLNGAEPKNLRIMQVAGDSMSPTINPDEWLIFDMIFNRDIEYIDGIYLINRDGSIQVKRLEFQGTKGVDIISDNTSYAVKNTVVHGIELEVIGKLYKHVVSYGAVVEK